jgi:hypothetical protein
MHFQKSLGNLVIEERVRSPLHTRINLVVTSPTSEQTAHLDYRKAADRSRDNSSEESIKLV